MNPYSQFIHKSRYARFRDDLGRRETWEETITRYLDYFEQDLDERHSYKLSHTLRSELYDAIHSLSIMPSMRAMMTAGEAARRCNVGVFNCLGGDTLVTTKEYGPIPIKELSGKSATIVDGNGSWQTVEFKSYGKQECYEVYALKGRRKVSIWATSNHDWVSIDGEKVRTEDIKHGLRVPHVIPPRNEIEYDLDYHLGLMHGVIYGDGTTMVRSTGGSTVKDIFVCERVHGYTIAACTDFEEIKPVFVNDFFKCSFAEPSLNSRGQVLFGRYTVPTNISRCVHMKELPESSESESYLIGFLRGWLAADGYISKTSQVSIAAGKEECEWIKQTYAKFGIVTGNVYEFPSRTNLGDRKKVLFKVDLDRRCLVEDDFILPRKRERFIPLDNGSIKLHVGKETRVMEVFCCTVPTTGSFVIEDNILTGNCSFSAIDTVRSFSEILYILMCGTGVGFSVERQSVSQLPPVPDTLTKTDHVIVVGDSKQGWAEAYDEFIQGLFAGHIARIDYSEIRPAGARLMTFGGRSSGPEPLRELFEFTTQIFHAARGRKLNSLECHSLCCKIGEIVVVGGVRRSALISLSNLSDQRMRDAKSGNWWMESPYLALANNSVAYTEKPEVGSFMDEWSSLYRSRSGERGIFNRQGAIRKVTASGRRDPRYDFGTNPCGEIILRSRQFCNLTETVVRPDDTESSLAEKIRLASILGTFQSTQTTYQFLSDDWRRNSEEERLLGVSLTGIFNSTLMSEHGPDLRARLARLKSVAISANVDMAHQVGIPVSAAVTTVKPSGTVSQLVNSPSGIHPSHAPYYIRRVRGDNKDPLTTFLRDAGVPCEPAVGKEDTTSVFSFPMQSHATKYREDISAIEHLRLIRDYNMHWSEHAVSCTVSVREHEWPSVGGWVYDHFDELAGVSFLPFFEGDTVYPQMPYETITSEAYVEMAKDMPESIPWDVLATYEGGKDHTKGSQELACVAGACEIVDIS